MLISSYKKREITTRFHMFLHCIFLCKLKCVEWKWSNDFCPRSLSLQVLGSCRGSVSVFATLFTANKNRNENIWAPPRLLAMKERNFILLAGFLAKDVNIKKSIKNRASPQPSLKHFFFFRKFVGLFCVFYKGAHQHNHHRPKRRLSACVNAKKKKLLIYFCARGERDGARENVMK